VVRRRILLFVFAALWIACGVPVRAAEPVFERDVLSIFAARCLSCHGGVTKKADLDLRNRASILKVDVKDPRSFPAIRPAVGFGA
jgi:hypothetical protein